jgi:flagellar L-ring protein FlgH
MKKIFGIFLFAQLVLQIGLGQDMRENTMRSLFSDQKANRVGDAVMIYVVETSSASNDAKTSSSRQGSVSLAGSGAMSTTPLPNVSMNLGTTNTFAGEGSTASNGSVQAKISARVDSVLPNGNLMIRGNRTIVINGEEQIISIAGIIRSSDIQADNSVYSNNISDAVIKVHGNGIVSRAQEPGWLTKIFHWLF